MLYSQNVGQVIKCSRNDSLTYIKKIRLQNRQNIHNLWVAKLCIILDYTKPIGRHHEAAEQNAFEFLTRFFEECFADEPVDFSGFMDVLLGQERKRVVGARVRTHTTGIRSGVAIARSLVILNRMGCAM